jgi:hypothetical protein
VQRWLEAQSERCAHAEKGCREVQHTEAMEVSVKWNGALEFCCGGEG